MNVILCEKNYFDSNWCQEILLGLKGELKKRRAEYTVVFNFDGISCSDTLYIIGSDYRFISRAVYEANSIKMTPIVIFNQLDHIISGHYHSVSSDVGGSVSALVARLIAKNKKNICLYGINPASISDISRAQSYLSSLGADAKTFYNNGSLQKCFDDMMQCGDGFDGVICVNDFAAASLVKNLLEKDAGHIDEIDIISCSRSAISMCYREYIKSVNVNFASLGANAYAISRTVEHGENISEISLKVKWDMDLEEDTRPIEYPPLQDASNEFYCDAEFAKLSKIDSLMEHCDELDIKIIKRLLAGKTYIDIADECHMVEQSVKYRVKQYTEICRIKNRRELVSLLNEYHVKL